MVSLSFEGLNEGLMADAGSINITNLALPYNAVAAGLTGHLISGILTIGISLLSESLHDSTSLLIELLSEPDDYDFAGTRAIAEVGDDESLASLEKVDSKQDEGGEMIGPTISYQHAEVFHTFGTTEEERAVLREAFRKAAIYSLVRLTNIYNDRRRLIEG